MVNPNKVRLMMKISSFEKRNKRKLDNLTFFKHDYVGFNVFLILLGVSISLVLFFLADLGTKFVDDMQNFINLDFPQIAGNYISILVIVLVVYGVIGSIVFRKKYRASVEAGDKLERMLKKLRKY